VTDTLIGCQLRIYKPFKEYSVPLSGWKSFSWIHFCGYLGLTKGSWWRVQREFCIVCNDKVGTALNCDSRNSNAIKITIVNYKHSSSLFCLGFEVKSCGELCKDTKYIWESRGTASRRKRLLNSLIEQIDVMVTLYLKYTVFESRPGCRPFLGGFLQIPMLMSKQDLKIRHDRLPSNFYNFTGSQDDI
jgi:hypothetical protein